MITKPRDPAKMLRSSAPLSKKRRFSPLMLIGVSVPVLLALIGVGIVVGQPHFGSQAAALNQNCTLIIPPEPLSARGLATPYQLTATDPAQGPCNEANPNQSAFVQAAILNPDNGQISVYNPLVVDQGTQPAIKPAVPQLPREAVVGIWFGDNGNVLTLLKNNARQHGKSQAGSLGQRTHFGFRGGNNGNCVNGVNGSPFGQFSFCNAPAFFQAANLDIRLHKLKIPALGTATDGQPCPTTRSFAIVDMDPSDNVQTQYLVNANGQTAQLTDANKARLPNATTIGNPSDNALVTRILDPVLGCKPFQAPDLANNNKPISALALDELQAAASQKAPIAQIPAGDPMVLVNGQPNLLKLNLYRVGVNQQITSLNGASTTTFCQNLVKVALPRLQLDMNTFQMQASPDGGATANSLFTFLANRLNATLGNGGLNCVGLLNIQNPVALTTDANGVVTAATITTTPVPANAANTGATGNGQTATPATPAATATAPAATAPAAKATPAQPQHRRHN